MRLAGVIMKLSLIDATGLGRLIISLAIIVNLLGSAQGANAMGVDTSKLSRAHRRVALYRAERYGIGRIINELRPLYKS